MRQFVNPFEFSDDNKRYHTLYYHLRHKFGKRVVKAAVNSGFSCPNIDGTCGFGGCTYCSGGSGVFAGLPTDSITLQLENERIRIRKKYPDADLIAYFQPNTNTYAPLDRLKAVYEEALCAEGVVGISIATRADCLDGEKVEYIAQLAKKTYLTVELGLQTIFDETAERINRGHSFSTFKDAFSRLKDAGVRTCVHVINGLPGESTDMMVETVRVLGKMKADAVKIHSLHIMKNTVMEKQYANGEFELMSMEDYIETVCRQICVLPPETVVERVTGDGDKRELIAPEWSTNKIAVLGGIDKCLADTGRYQGIDLK